MASEVKADKLSPSSGTALQLGDASDTITVPTGATFTVTDGIGVAGGGTGLTSLTAGDVLYATGTTTLAKLAKGTAEQVLAMNSGATAPDWGSVDLTVLPTITAAKGGTGQTSYTTGDTVYASGSTAVSKLGIGTARQALQTNSGATAPEWVNSPQSLMTAAGDILYASGANTLAKLAKGSNDEVLTLAAGVPSWAAAASGGLSVADQWRMTSDFSVSSTSVVDITANLERVDTSGQGTIGSAMTESSGIFTFPSTGVYLVTADYSFYLSDHVAWIQSVIQATVDNSSYAEMSSQRVFIYQTNSTATYIACHTNSLIDVTDVTNVKVKFGCSRESNTPVAYAGTSNNHTYFTFLRLGDT